MSTVSVLFKGYEQTEYIIRKKWLFYPLIKQDVYISTSKERVLNVIEKAVLHLFYVKISLDKIHDVIAEIGIKKDIKDAVINKLKSVGYLEGYKVTEEGEKALFSEEKKQVGRLKKAAILKDPFTNSIVPFYTTSFNPFLIRDEKKIRFNAGDEGEPVNIIGFKADLPRDISNGFDVDVAREAIREHCINESKPRVYHLEKAEMDELELEIVYVPLEVYIKKGAYDWRVSDPFGKDEASLFWKSKVEDLIKRNDYSAVKLLDSIGNGNKKEGDIKNKIAENQLIAMLDRKFKSKKV